MGRRMVLLVVAIVVAAMGTGLVFAYVNRTDARALRDQEPVQVLVAKTLIKAGTTGAEAERDAAFELRAIPRLAALEGYLTESRSIAELVAVSDIFPGEQIIAPKFAAAGSTSGLTLPEGSSAMSVQMGDPQRVAGFVRPGSEVAVLLTIDVNARDGGGQPRKVTRMLLPRVEVLAIGPTTLRAETGGETNTEPLPTTILTLAVDQVQGQKLAYATTEGQLYFMLVNEESKVGPGGPIHIDNLFS